MPRDKAAGETTGKEGSLIKEISWDGVGDGANASVVDVKDDRIVRIRPLHYDWKYKPEEFKPWVMKARGRTSSRARRASSLHSAWPTRNGSTPRPASATP